MIEVTWIDRGALYSVRAVTPYAALWIRRDLARGGIRCRIWNLTDNTLWKPISLVTRPTDAAATTRPTAGRSDDSIRSKNGTTTAHALRPVR